jgi:hypothetical protein
MMKHSLALVSAFFFWWPVTEILILLFPYSGSVVWIAALIPTGVVSLTGSILLFHVTTDSIRRYPAVLLCLDIFLVLVTGLASFYLSGSFPANSPAIFWAFALLVLAPVSAAVFFSIPPDSLARSVSINLGALISAYSMLTMILLLYAGYEPMLGLLYIYWLFGMPILGISFLARAYYG